MGILTEKLKKLNSIPMHMPGHKRNGEKFAHLSPVLAYDITEIDGYDNLHSPSGILKESMQNAAKVFKSENSIYLVNGSTCGILASVMAIAQEGDRVIVDRNSHKSVYNALELSGAEPVYIRAACHSEYGITTGITPTLVEDTLKANPDAKLIIVTSPTYEGVISDIRGICKVAKEYNIPVLVDGAHGAHLGFYKFPKRATELGADIVVESLHKTLPSLTQTAILHVKDRYKSAAADKLSVFETSSPSYVLLSSIECCVDALADESLFADWYNSLLKFRDDAKKLKNLKVLEKCDAFFDYDISKIVIMTSNSHLLAKRLRENNIEPEMVSSGYIVCMTGPGDTTESLKALCDVLFKIDGEFSPFEKNTITLPVPKRIMSPKSAKKAENEYLPTELCEGKIAAEYIWAYPPGVPLLVPGEEIDEELIRHIEDYTKAGVTLSGNSTFCEGKILVIKT